jgi:hypothetical protein
MGLLRRIIMVKVKGKAIPLQTGPALRVPEI